MLVKKVFDIRIEDEEAVFAHLESKGCSNTELLLAIVQSCPDDGEPYKATMRLYEDDNPDGTIGTYWDEYDYGNDSALYAVKFKVTEQPFEVA